MPASGALPGERLLPGPFSALVWASLAAGLGLLSAGAPFAAAGLTAAVVLFLVPWPVLFAILAFASIFQGSSTIVAGLTVRPDELVVAVFAARAFLSTERVRFGRTEWLLVAFVAVQAATSLLHAEDVRASLQATALLSVGALAYLAVEATVTTRRRLVFATRALLAAITLAAAAGLIAVVSHLVVGTLRGVTLLPELEGFPAATGFAFEHNIFGSTVAAGAIVFLALWLERNPVLSRRSSAMGFWLCMAALAASLTRGAWIGFACGFVVLLLVSRGKPMAVVARRLAVQALAVGAAFAVVAVVLFPGAGGAGSLAASTIKQQAGRILDLETYTGATRLLEWKIALADVPASPLFGLGTNSYGQRHLEPTVADPEPAYLGNWAIRTLYDSGIVGLALLSAFLASVVWPVRGLRRARGDLASVARALTLGGVVLAVSYLATDAFLLAWPWVFLGLTRASRAFAQEQEMSSVSAE